MDFLYDDDREEILQSCLKRQTKSLKVLKLGITFLILSLITIVIVIGITICIYHTPTNKWVYQKCSTFTNRFNFLKARNGILSETYTFKINNFFYSSNKKYALTLLPELYILCLDQKNPVCHWKLPTPHREVVGNESRLLFHSTIGILEFYSTDDFVIWSTRENNQFQSKKTTTTTTNQAKSSSSLPFSLSSENQIYNLHLTDEGNLQILSFKKWESIRSTSKVIEWDSSSYASRIKMEKKNYLRLKSNYLFYHILHDSRDRVRLLFNQDIGLLQIVQKKGNHQWQITWQSHYVHQGTYPWFCVMSSIGIIVILDKYRNVIWASNFYDIDYFTFISPSSKKKEGLALVSKQWKKWRNQLTENQEAGELEEEGIKGCDEQKEDPMDFFETKKTFSNSIESQEQQQQQQQHQVEYKMEITNKGDLLIVNENTNQILWQTMQLNIPQFLYDTNSDIYLINKKDQKKKSFNHEEEEEEEEEEEKEIQIHTEIEGVKDRPLNREEIEEWFWCQGYRFCLPKNCMIGTDFFLPHQKLFSLLDETILDLNYEFSFFIQFLLYLDDSNEKNSVLSLCCFHSPISIYSSNLVVLCQTAEKLKSNAILLQSKKVLEKKDHPCIVKVQQNHICLLTFHGVLLQKMPIQSLVRKCLSVFKNTKE